MNRGSFTESTVESAVAWLESLGWRVAPGPGIAPNMAAAERQDFREVVLAQRLRAALLRKPIRGEIRVEDAERFLKERGL